MKIFIMLMAMALWCGNAAHAQQQEVHVSPLFACPDYGQGQPLVSDLSWSVNCLLQAIYDGDRKVVADLSAGARCDGTSCDAERILYIGAAEFIFGFKNTGKAWEGSPIDAIQTVLKRSSHVLVTYSNLGPGEIEVHLIPRPGKARVRLGEGFNRDYYVCDFKYDAGRSLWVISGSFCQSESDSFIQAADLEQILDLNGNGNETQPVLTWKPRTSR